MATLTNREAQDILKMVEDENHYPMLPEYRKTVAVSLAAVTLCAHHLEYVPEAVISKEFEGRHICRAALQAKDAGCIILPYIPFADVQKEAVKMFIDRGDPHFTVYSFADITDAQTAMEAVKADAYCIQLVPPELMTASLCKAALQSPTADKNIPAFIPEKFQTAEIRKIAEDKFGEKREQKENRQPERITPAKRKGISV